MADFLALSAEEKRHELVALEQALLTKKEVYRRLHGHEATPQPRRRSTDQPREDHMAERNGGIDIGYKGAHVGARGPLGILALVFVLVGAVLIWVNHKGFADTNDLLRQSIAGHDRIAASQDLLACVVSLSAEERTRVRQQPTRDAFVILCPWLRQDATR